ncbi:hypothetical protein LCGC14_2360600, partial [marine sediment metagenome]
MNKQRSMTTERRRHPRTQLKMTLHGVRLDPDGGDVYDTLQMTDISRCGLGALADRWLYPGQRIVLCLPLHPDGGRRNIYSTVIRCKKDRDDYHIGLEFDRGSLDAA